MDMTMPSTATATATAATAATAFSPSSTMSSSMSMGGSCKISMLWNWNTIDSCFIAKSWHIRSHGMFAGSCIAVIVLVMSLEFLRRLVKEYDRYLIRAHRQAVASRTAVSPSSTARGSLSNGDSGGKQGAAGADTAMANACPAERIGATFRPDIFQQALRALLHTLQFAVAYFVMLLAMYYNGYLIICIFIGAYLGSFVFHWEPMTVADSQTSAASEATVCCG